jgi:hypothetical protein
MARKKYANNDLTALAKRLFAETKPAERYQPQMDKRLFTLLSVGPALLAGAAVRKPLAAKLFHWRFPEGRLSLEEAVKRLTSAGRTATVGGWLGAGATAAGTQQALHRFVLPKLDKKIYSPEQRSKQ